MPTHDVDVVVVGGGVSGLAAAVAHRALGRRVHVLEASKRVGGLIASELHERFVLEHGADSLLATEPHVVTTLAAHGLMEDVVRDGTARRRAFIATRSALHPVPAGLFRFERHVVLSLLASPLLSTTAKARLFAEPFIGRGPGEDESAARFFERRLGKEVASRLVDPMLRGVFGAPASTLGIRAVMPTLARMEETHGSIALALALPRPPPRGLGLVTLRRGMESLPVSMARSLGDAVSIDACVVGLARLSTGWSVTTAGGSRISARHVVLACPARHAARLLAPLSDEVAEVLSRIESSRADVVTLGFDALDRPLPDGTGFVSQSRSRHAIAACTFASAKWRGRAPESFALLRVVLDRPDLEDEALLELVRAELREILDVTAAPSLVRMRRLEHALPRYGVGHRARVARIRARAAETLPGVSFAGNAYDGIGIAQCLASGTATAHRTA